LREYIAHDLRLAGAGLDLEMDKSVQLPIGGASVIAGGADHFHEPVFPKGASCRDHDK
jgi:hypothetical protein